MANRLRRAGLPPVGAALVREGWRGGEDLAARIKARPVVLEAPMGLDRAISSAGGLGRDRLDPVTLMLRDRPGVFAAGEMLDWEAPTGGHLLTACLATGRAAGLSAAAWLQAAAPAR